jgi:hypothetical protein
MHQFVLLTAMTAASGLFGGRPACTTGQCPSTVSWAPTVRQAPAAPAPVYYRPYAAPQATYAAPRTFAPAAYPYPAVPSCANGTCPRR